MTSSLPKNGVDSEEKRAAGQDGTVHQVWQLASEVILLREGQKWLQVIVAEVENANGD
jgi:hypothetical protein